MELKACVLSFEGFPPPTYVIPPPVAFPMGSGYTFPAGVSVPGTFLQPAAHAPAGKQVQAGKQSHIPYSQQRPSGPGPLTQGPPQPQPPVQPPLAPLPAQPAAQPTGPLQVHALSQQQSPTKAGPGLGKSPPHHSGFQQVCGTACLVCLFVHLSIFRVRGAKSGPHPHAWHPIFSTNRQTPPNNCGIHLRFKAHWGKSCL